MSVDVRTPLTPQQMAAEHAERTLARLEAHRLVQQVQVRDTGVEVAERLAVAESRSWPEVARVLLYADLVHEWTSGRVDLDARIRRLHDRAERDGDSVMLAAALASRSEYRYASASASTREQANKDLARAVAILDVAEGGALELGTAFIDCGLGYSQRELWELEERMYDRAAAVLPSCEEPLLDRALSLNRASLRVNQACSLREMGEHAELAALASGAPPDTVDSAAADPAADVFGVEERVAKHLLARLLSAEPTEQSADLDLALTTARHPSAAPEHGRLRLADALLAAQRGDWAEVAVQTATAMLLFGDSVCPPVIAMTLRLATQAEIAKRSGGDPSGLAYGDWSARRRWDARLQLLSAARAGLETEQLRVERDEHARQAHVDELTGLANRRGYSRHTARLRARTESEPAAALVVDVDAFKAVNDTFGHAVGDAVLVQVAHVLSTGIRQADLVARLGGDEFVVMLDGLDAGSAQRRATDIAQRLATTDWSVLAADLHVTISIGVAAGMSDDPQTFLERADEALYRGKSRGGANITLALP